MPNLAREATIPAASCSAGLSGHNTVDGSLIAAHNMHMHMLWVSWLFGGPCYGCPAPMPKQP